MNFYYLYLVGARILDYNDFKMMGRTLMQMNLQKIKLLDLLCNKSIQGGGRGRVTIKMEIKAVIQ